MGSSITAILPLSVGPSALTITTYDSSVLIFDDILEQPLKWTECNHIANVSFTFDYV